MDNQHVKEVIAVSPQRVEVILNDGKEIAFVINRKDKFGWSAKSHDISKPAFCEACCAAGRKFAEMKKLQQQPTAA